MDFYTSDYLVERDEDRCIRCGACVRQCANEVHSVDPDTGAIRADETKCVNCQRCVSICPTRALRIRSNPNEFRSNANWTMEAIKEVSRQAGSGGTGAVST